MDREEKTRILHIVPSLESGGIEKLLNNLYCKVDRNKYDFLFVTHKNDGAVYRELKQRNATIYYLPPKSQGILCYLSRLKKIISQSQCSIIHIHQGFMSFIPLLFAMNSGIKVRIVHAHSAITNESVFKRLINKCLRIIIQWSATDYFACSRAAAIYLYGKNPHKPYILKNGIDIDLYKQKNGSLNELRKQLGITQNKVIAMIARFTSEKNHHFAVEVFKQIATQNSDINFIFIGDGELRNSIETHVATFTSKDRFIFLGNREDVHTILHIVDYLILPSYYEGLGIVLIEAQVHGIRASASNFVPREANVTDLVDFINLNAGALYWANHILERLCYDKKERLNEISKAGYDINEVVALLQAKYSSLNDSIKTI